MLSQTNARQQALGTRHVTEVGPSVQLTSTIPVPEIALRHSGMIRLIAASLWTTNDTVFGDDIHDRSHDPLADEAVDPGEA